MTVQQLKFGPAADADDAPGADLHPRLSSDMDEALTPRERRRRSLRRLLLPVLAGVILLGAILALAFHRSGDVAVPLRELQIATAQVERVTEEARFVGRATPKDLLEIPAPESGRVVEVFAKSGDRVVAGQPLLKLSNPERELAISDRMSRIRSDMMTIMTRDSDMAGAKVGERKGILEAEQSSIEAAEQLRRRESLLKAGVVNEANVKPLRERMKFADRVLGQARSASAESDAHRGRQRSALNSQLDALRADYAAAARQRDAFTIAAPADGVVLGLDATIGQALDLGSRVAGVDPQRGLRVVAQLDEFYAGRVEAGLGATITTSSGPAQLRVVHVSPDVRDGSFKVELEFTGRPPSLRPGETVQGSISFPTAGSYVALPIGPYLEQTGGNWLFVLSTDGKSAERRAVRSGPRSSRRVAILSGLRSGERVVTSSYRPWANVNTMRITD